LLIQICSHFTLLLENGLDGIKSKLTQYLIGLAPCKTQIITSVLSVINRRNSSIEDTEQDIECITKIPQCYKTFFVRDLQILLLS